MRYYKTDKKAGYTYNIWRCKNPGTISPRYEYYRDDINKWVKWHALNINGRTPGCIQEISKEEAFIELL